MTNVIMRASNCGHHFTQDCLISCQSARDCSNHEMDSLRSEITHLRTALEEIAKNPYSAVRLAEAALANTTNER